MDVAGELVAEVVRVLPWHLALLVALAFAVLVVLGRRLRSLQLEVKPAPPPVSDGGTAADEELRTRWERGDPDAKFNDAG